MGNVEGKAYSLTCISPMRPCCSLILRFFFLLRRMGLFGETGAKLKKLSFIHFARWVIVRRGEFPRLAADQPAESLKYDYLFFCSNFNGSWDEYIDAFSEIIPDGMDHIWRWSEKYPGSVPITPFKKFIRFNQADTDYYYSAYPGATTTDVKAALNLLAELESFSRQSSGLTPAQFRASYEQFLTRVQRNLNATGPVGT